MAAEAAAACAAGAGGSGTDDDVVLSDVHMETCPPGPGPWVTRFAFMEPPDPASIHVHNSSHSTPNADAAGDSSAGTSTTEVDDDGDMLLNRRSRRDQYMQMHHALVTPISRCGEQVWPGALLLGDYLLSQRQLLQGRTVLELGTGVGLAGVIAARGAKHVLLTDAHDSALALAAKNSGANNVQAEVSLRRLNWLDFLGVAGAQLGAGDMLQLLQGKRSDAGTGGSNSAQQASSPCKQCDADKCSAGDCGAAGATSSTMHKGDSFAWSAADLDVLADVDLILAADCVYDSTLTEALMHTAACLMAWAEGTRSAAAAAVGAAGGMPLHARPGQESGHGTAPSSCAAIEQRSVRMLVALEKRYTFTLRDMDSRAPAFEHFLTFVSQQGSLEAAAQSIRSQGVVEGNNPSHSKPVFVGRRLCVQKIPQLLQYDRTSELELWELALH